MCEQLGLIYYPALRVSAAKTAEQSKADRECKSIAIVVFLIMRSPQIIILAKWRIIRNSIARKGGATLEIWHIIRNCFLVAKRCKRVNGKDEPVQLLSQDAKRFSTPNCPDCWELFAYMGRPDTSIPYTWYPRMTLSTVKELVVVAVAIPLITNDSAILQLCCLYKLAVLQ